MYRQEDTEMQNYFVRYYFDSSRDRDGFMEEIKAERIGEITLAEKGCLRYEYFFPADSDREIFLWEQWESEADQKCHMTQPHFDTIGKIKDKNRAQTEFEK